MIPINDIYEGLRPGVNQAVSKTDIETVYNIRQMYGVPWLNGSICNSHSIWSLIDYDKHTNYKFSVNNGSLLHSQGSGPISFPDKRNAKLRVFLATDLLYKLTDPDYSYNKWHDDIVSKSFK